MLHCTFHPTIATDRWCTKCARSACEACLVKVDFGQHCVGCTEGRRAPGEPHRATVALRAVRDGEVRLPAMRQRMVAAMGAGDARTRPGSMFGALVGAFAVACALAGAVSAQSISDPAPLARVAAIAVVLTGALLGLVLHEWGHAYVAFQGGDDGVVDKGYLTMDVRDYSHPALTIGFPLVATMLGGLPLPGGAVLIDDAALRNRWWDSAVSAAGPAMSMLFALVLTMASAAAGDGSVLPAALAFLAWIEVGLVLLNLLPIPGLDGYGILEPHLPDEITEGLRPVKAYGFVIVLAVVFGTHAVDFIWDWSASVSLELGVDPLKAMTGQALTVTRESLGARTS